MLRPAPAARPDGRALTAWALTARRRIRPRSRGDEGTPAARQRQPVIAKPPDDEVLPLGGQAAHRASCPSAGPPARASCPACGEATTGISLGTLGPRSG